MNVVLRILILLVIFAVSFQGIAARAEYRVFKLEITSEDGKSREVTTTLDHLQYRQLHPLNKGESVKYTDTWMCWENTSNRAPCVKLEKGAGTTPSS